MAQVHRLILEHGKAQALKVRARPRLRQPTLAPKTLTSAAYLADGLRQRYRTDAYPMTQHGRSRPIA
jgi:hypothetical protein